MSVNWVMIAENGGYTPLPGETTLYQSPQRTTLSLQTGHHRPPSEAYSQQCKSGVVYLTNRRIIYLPVTATPTFQSFAVPILNVADSRVTAPWFGANKWEAVIHPVTGGGIPPQHGELDCVMEFKEGGAFDFHNIFERLKERLRQTIDVARESGIDETVAAGNMNMEDLPAYEDTRQHARVPEEPLSPPASAGLGGVGAGGPVTAAAAPTPGAALPETDTPQRSSPLQSPRPFHPPSEPPPGYEEVQRGSIADELERRLSDPHWDEELRR